MIEAQDIEAAFGAVRVLAGVSLVLPDASITGLVGESGSGKTTLLRVLMGLLPPSAGTVRVDGVPLATVIAQDPLAYRRRAQMLLQDAAGSLSPRMTVRRLLAEPASIHGLDPKESWAHTRALLRRLGLQEAILDKYPHQISGGQARRVAAARALVLRPALLVADEPTAGLDVSVQGELLNLLLERQRDEGFTLLVSSHNLNVVRRVCTRMVVLYLGQVMEWGDTSAVFGAPAHPYTAALLSTNPAIDPARRSPRIPLPGEIPSVAHPPAGCRFHTRCPGAQPRCVAEQPALRQVAGRWVRCHFPLAG